MQKLFDLLFIPVFLATFLGVYTSLTLEVGAGEIAAFPGLAMGAVACAIYWRQLLSNVWRIGLLMGTALLPTLLATITDLPLDHAMLAFALLTASVLIGVATYVGVKRQNQVLFMWVLGAVLCAFVLAGLLEEYTGFRAVSDAFRHAVYTGRFVYEGDSRDEMFYGIARAKVFSQEPSFPAKACAFISFSFLALSRKWWEWAFGLVVTAAALFTFRSPEMMAAILLIGSLVTLRFLNRKGKLSPAFVNTCVAVAIVMMIVVTLDAQSIALLIGGNRGKQIADGTDGSTVERILLPPKVFLETLKTTWLGLGLGVKQSINSIVKDVVLEFPNFRPLILPGDTIIWGDGFYELLISLGPLFGLAFAGALCWLFRSKYFLLPCLLFAVVFILDPGVQNPRNWFYFALVAAAYELGLQPRPVAVKKAVAVYKRPEPRRRVIAGALTATPVRPAEPEVGKDFQSRAEARPRVRPEPRRRVVKTDPDQTPES